MNKALIKSKAAEANDHWHNMALNVMERSWMIGKALYAIKSELGGEPGIWQAWCEANLSFGYSHASRFLAIGALPKKPELPKIASNAMPMPLLSIENLALVAGRVKKGIAQELAIKEALFPPAPPVTHYASDDEAVKEATVVVPDVKTKAKAKEYLTRPLALDIIGIVSDKEDVDVFVNRTSLEILFEGLETKHKADEKKMRALKAAKLVLL